MCFSCIKNIKSLTSKNSGTLIVIKNPLTPIAKRILGNFKDCLRMVQNEF
jgi:hypothetical protein